MAKLNQFVAVEKTTKENTNKQTAPLFHNAKKPELFAGLTKTYEPLDEDGATYPPEDVRVQLTVDEVLEAFTKPMTRLFDVLATKETANTLAFGDIIVDEVTLLEKVPVSFLLQLEKQLTSEVRGLIVSLPTLDPAQEWQPAPDVRPGVFTTETIKRHKTSKLQRPIVLYEATKEFPAQTQLIAEDVLAGYWSEKKFSGAISGTRKQELLDRVDKLIAAVKFAREQANNRTVEDVNVSTALFGYLFTA